MAAPRVLALIGDYDGCSWWRIVRPYERMAEAGLYTAYANKDDIRVSEIAHLYDAVVMPRLSWADHRIGRRFINALHRAGLCVVYEVDDDLFSPHINARMRQTVQSDLSPEELEQRRLDRLAALRLCDGVTVSSQRLGTVMRSIVDMPVLVVPNAIDARWWRGRLRGYRRQLPRPVIGWAGGARPGDDLAHVAEAWRRVAESHPSATFACVGWQPTEFNVLGDRLIRIPWQPLDAYPRVLAEFDIACCSVANNAFSRAKTPIKVWEATLSGAAVVASPTLYGAAVTDGVDGLLAETADAWTAALTRLLDDPDERRRLRRNQRRRVAGHHTLDKNLWRWPTAYAEIIEQYRRRPRVLVA